MLYKVCHLHLEISVWIIKILK